MESDVLGEPHLSLLGEDHVVKHVTLPAVTKFHIVRIIGSATAPIASDPLSV